jgi:hypothetical protein
MQQKVDFIDVEKATTDGVSTLLNQLKGLREVKSRYHHYRHYRQ